MTTRYPNGLKRVEFVFSDVHSVVAARGIREVARQFQTNRERFLASMGNSSLAQAVGQESVYLRAILNGDETAHPPINPLREIKKQAIAEGVNPHIAEAQAWRDPRRRTGLVTTYRPCYEESLTIIRTLEDLRADGYVHEFVKHEGNDGDRLQRISEAEQWAVRESGNVPRPDLTDIITHSQFSTVLREPHVELCEHALTLRIPYIESRNANLALYLSSISEQLTSTKVRFADVEQALIISHTNVDPRFRREKKNGWWKDVYAIIRRHLPHAAEGKVAHISGHDHYTLPLDVHPTGMYQYEGVWQLKIGMSDGNQKIPEGVADLYQGHANPHLQRSLLYLAADPLGTMQIIDRDIL
ncbi:MAG: hypothetical protein Q7K45_06945 [Nanoarchaeota archaeon]|nr:hypothetical protein [Nanoarchaeota archaeon]